MTKVIGIKESHSDAYPNAITYYCAGDREGVQGLLCFAVWCKEPFLADDKKPLEINSEVQALFSFKYKHFYFKK